MRTIAVLNQKGGVGKTTTVANTSAALASMGSRVVVIDMDPQAHLTIHLGIESQAIEAGSYKVLTQSANFEQEIMLVRPNLWLLPANINLVGAETELVSVVGRETILREAIEPSEDKFDYCIIDCAPSLGLLTLNALAVANEVLIPLQPHFLALQGLGQLLQTVELVNKRINPKLKVEGILLCMFDSRASLPGEVKADIEQFLENARGSNLAWSQAQILPTCIRTNIKLAEAPSYGKTIFEYEKNCHGAEDYLKVAQYIHGQFQVPPEPEIQPAAAENQAQPAIIQTPESQPKTQTPQLNTGPVIISPEQSRPSSAPKPIIKPYIHTPSQPDIQPANTGKNHDQRIIIQTPESQPDSHTQKKGTEPVIISPGQSRPSSAPKPIIKPHTQAPSEPDIKSAADRENQAKPDSPKSPQIDEQSIHTPKKRQTPPIQIKSISGPAPEKPSDLSQITPEQDPPDTAQD